MINNSISVCAYAKINFMLNVAGKRTDGYHELQTVMLPVSLFDEVYIEKANETIVFCSDMPGGNSNTGLLALRAYQEYCKTPPVHIHIKKRIPEQSGLGGGSSDAAAVLLGLNSLFGALTIAQLEKAALKVGADVPACLAGAPVYATGIGEILQPIKTCKLHLLLAMPADGISTGRLFSSLDVEELKKFDPHRAIAALSGNDLPAIAQTIGNSLLAPACRINPQIEPLLEELKASGALGVGMSGSGSCCFGIFETRKQAKQAEKIIGSPFVHACSTV